MEKRGKRGGESICFLSGVQLEEEQTTKEEEAEEGEVPASLRTCLTQTHTCRLPQGNNPSYFLLCVFVCISIVQLG